MYDKVVVIGSLNYDVCLKLERLPEEGETNFADSVEYCSGGKGANQAVQAAKLGVPVYMAGCIGEDSSGDFLKKTVEGYGVRTDYLKRVPGNSGMSVAQSLYDGGIRAFEFTNRGDGAHEVFKEVMAFVRAECPEMVLGAGTMLDDSGESVTVVSRDGEVLVQGSGAYTVTVESYSEA